MSRQPTLKQSLSRKCPWRTADNCDQPSTSATASNVVSWAEAQSTQDHAAEEVASALGRTPDSAKVPRNHTRKMHLDRMSTVLRQVCADPAPAFTALYAARAQALSLELCCYGVLRMRKTLQCDAARAGSSRSGKRMAVGPRFAQRRRRTRTSRRLQRGARGAPDQYAPNRGGATTDVERNCQQPGDCRICDRRWCTVRHVQHPSYRDPYSLVSISNLIPCIAELKNTALCMFLHRQIVLTLQGPSAPYGANLL